MLQEEDSTERSLTPQHDACRNGNNVLLTSGTPREHVNAIIGELIRNGEIETTQQKRDRYFSEDVTATNR